MLKNIKSLTMGAVFALSVAFLPQLTPAMAQTPAAAPLALPETCVPTFDASKNVYVAPELGQRPDVSRVAHRSLRETQAGRRRNTDSRRLSWPARCSSTANSTHPLSASRPRWRSAGKMHPASTRRSSSSSHTCARPTPPPACLALPSPAHGWSARVSDPPR